MAVTKEDCSHCALEFDTIGIIVHSNLYGVHIEGSDTFKSKVEIVHELGGFPDDFNKLAKMLAKKERNLYDFGAICFIGICLLAKKYLKLPLPKVNLWQSSSMDICTEWVTGYVECKTDSMITPHKLYDRLKTKSLSL